MFLMPAKISDIPVFPMYRNRTGTKHRQNYSVIGSNPTIYCSNKGNIDMTSVTTTVLVFHILIFFPFI